MTLKLIKTNVINESDKLLNTLNDSQKLAVETIDGPVLIIAGAGSGKTRVLTYRIAHMIHQGIKADNILALTFTNKAANEMRQRIASLVSKDAVNKIWVGTFHSIFARILRFESQTLGYTSSFTIYDTDDSLNLIKHVMNDNGISQLKHTAQNIRNKISYHKNQIQTWQDLADAVNDAEKRFLADIYRSYEEELKRSNSMDFDDLLINMIRLLSNNPEILNKYTSRFKYILVDEFQDTNRPQYIVCKLLSGVNKNICVVGDDAQSIYKWRGADIRNILEFRNDFQNTKIIKLERNYRSTKNILSAADSVIKNNRKQIPKTLITENEDGEKVKIVNCIDEVDEAEYIIKTIIDNQKENLSVKDCAVLYRTNAQSLAFENVCRKYNLPYIIVGGMSFYKRKEVKDILAYLKFLCNPKDSESLLRIINEPPRGIGATTINHFREYARFNKLSLYESFSSYNEIADLQLRSKNAVAEFIKLNEMHIDLRKTTEPKDFASKYIESTGLLNFYREMNTEDSMDRLNNIQQVLSDISQFYMDNPELELEDYLQQISLISDIDEKDITLDRLKLMTIHASKGLEFQVVFITGLEKGLFPFSRNEQSGDDEEEERRLFYVAITRSMKKLFITYARRRIKFGDWSNQSPSKFLLEIDSSHIERFSSNGFKDIGYQIQSKEALAPIKKNYFSQIPESDNDEHYTFNGQEYKVGDRVRHTHFGSGQIVSLAGSGQNLQATVNFKDAGRKKLMLAYAKLQKI